jgi:hypothetical protein
VTVITPCVDERDERKQTAVAAFGSSPNVTVVAPEKGIKSCSSSSLPPRPSPARSHLAPPAPARRPTSPPRYCASASALHVPFRGMPEILHRHHVARPGCSCRPRHRARSSTKLAQETQKALAAPGVREKLAQQGMDPMPITPAAFDAQIRREIDSILALAKAANLKFN